MGFFPRRKLESRIVQYLHRCQLKPESVRPGNVVVAVAIRHVYRVKIEEVDRFTRITGDPSIQFSPRRCPERLLANLLLRNGEAGSGGWRLLPSKDQIRVCFSYGIPTVQLTFPSFVFGLEHVLAEVDRVSFKYSLFNQV